MTACETMQGSFWSERFDLHCGIINVGAGSGMRRRPLTALILGGFKESFPNGYQLSSALSFVLTLEVA